MRNDTETTMIRLALATLVAFSGLLAACADPTTDDGEDVVADDEGDDESATRPRDPEAQSGIRPFHVAVFDHAPTEEEINLDFQSFLSVHEALAGRGSNNLVNPSSFQSPAAGQKLVRLDARTSNINNAGTDESKYVSFTGKWNVDAIQYSEKFVLDNLGTADLNRNETSVYYYLLNLNQYVAGATHDVFNQGKIANTGSNGWHCAEVKVIERTSSGALRTQSLPFNQWVDDSESGWMAGNNTQSLSY